MFIVTPRRKPFRMNHDSRFSSHSSSILFRICVAVAAVMAGSYEVGSVSWVQLRLVRWVYSMSPMISARNSYSSPVAVSRLHVKVMFSTLLARSEDASFLSSS